MFTFFKKKAKKEIFAFASGTIKPLQEVQDEAFAKGLLGPGIAIVPTEGTIVSPVNGEITMVFPTKHAIGIKADNGWEILLHIGIDTVTLQGEGFTTIIKEKQRVRIGEVLVVVDLSLLKDNDVLTDTMCVITNPMQSIVEPMVLVDNPVIAGKDIIARVKDET